MSDSDSFDTVDDKGGQNADEPMLDSDDDEVKMTIRLPKRKREKFKRRCKNEGVNMSVAVRRFVTRALSNEIDLL